MPASCFSGAALWGKMAGMSSAKSSAKDSLTLLLFRMGDFYETFDEDARKASHALDMALTSRSMGKGSPAPLAGAPAHSLAKERKSRSMEFGRNFALWGGQEIKINDRNRRA